MTIGGQAALELEVILDDAVVDEGNTAAAVGVGVGVVVGGRTVGGPAGVAEAQGAAGRGADELGGQAADFADGLAQVSAPVSSTTAMPALSYPRYSRRLSPS